MDTDHIMKIARHFNWNTSKMQSGWIMANDQDRLTLRNMLGMDFDKELPANFPEMKYSHKSTNDGYCPVCYGGEEGEALDDSPASASFYINEC
jgi:hypothetical protein